MGLRLEHDVVVDLEITTGASGVYAIVRDESGNALFNTAGAYTLEAFTAANQDTFAIRLVEGSEFSRHWLWAIANGDLTLPANGYGEYYAAEIWETPSTGSISRSTDTLREVQKFQWADTRKAPVIIDKSQERYECHMSVAYEPSTLTAKFMCWLEKNGEIVNAVDQCILLWENRTGTELLNTTKDAATYMNTEGYFIFEAAGIALAVDSNSAVTVTIRETDTAATKHSSGHAANHWD